MVNALLEVSILGQSLAPNAHESFERAPAFIAHLTPL
jgi:hypothetical protein